MTSALTELIAFVESNSLRNDILRTEVTEDKVIIVLHAEAGFKSIIQRVERKLSEVDPARTLSILYVYDNGRIAYP